MQIQSPYGFSSLQSPEATVHVRRLTTRLKPQDHAIHAPLTLTRINQRMPMKSEAATDWAAKTFPIRASHGHFVEQVMLKEPAKN